MKKNPFIAGFFVLGIVTLYLFGGIFFETFRAHHRHSIKQTVLHQLSEEQLTPIFSATELSDDEFQYHSRMYDVVRVEKVEAGYMYFCFEDSKETLLHQMIYRQLLQEEQHIPRNFSFFYSIFSVKIAQNYFKYIFEPTSEALNIANFPYLKTALSSGFVHAFFPPPIEQYLS